jgi:hypothetical protein
MIQMSKVRVKIEHGGHVIFADLPAVPRVGDYVRCPFPASGLPMLHLKVARVYFHMTGGDFEGRDCPNEFMVILTTEGDPEMAEHDKAAVLKASGLGQG